MKWSPKVTHYLATASIMAAAIIMLFPIIIENGYPAFHDLSPIWSFKLLFRPFNYPWDIYSNLGAPVILPSNLIYNVGLITLSFLLRDVGIAHKLYLFLLLTLVGLLYAFFFRITGIGSVGSYTAGFLMVMNHFTWSRIIQGHNTILFALPLSALPLIAYASYLKRGSLHRLMLAGLLSGLLAYVSPHLAYMVFIVIAVLAFAHTRCISSLARVVIKLLIVFLMALGASAPTLLRLYMEGREFNFVRVEEALSPLSIVDLLSMKIVESTYLLLFMVMIVLITVFTKREKIGIPRPYTISFIMVMFIGLLLAAGNLREFHTIYSFLISYIPGLLIFRESNKFLFLFAIGFSYIAGSFINRVWGMGTKVQALAILLFLVFSASFSIYPVYTNYGKIGSIEPSSELKMLFDKLSSLGLESRAAFFPPAVWAAAYRWSDRWFLDPIMSLQQIPTVELKGDEDVSNSADVVRWVYAAIAGNRTDRVREMFQLLSVKYFVVREDVYLPDYRDDLRFVKMINNSLIESQLLTYNFMKVGRSYKLYELSNSPRIEERVSGYSLIFGDRSTIITAIHYGFNFSERPPVFIGDAKSIDGLINVIIDGYMSSIFNRFAEGSEVVRISPAEFIQVSVRYDNNWVSGRLLWHIRGGMYSSAPHGFILNEGVASVRIPLRVEQSTYEVYLAYLAKDETEIEVSIDGKISRIMLKGGERYRIAPLGGFLLNSSSYLTIRNLGGEVSIGDIYLIREGDKKRKTLNEIDIIYYFEDDLLQVSEGLVVRSNAFSNGRALIGDDFTLNFTPSYAGLYSIYIATQAFDKTTLTLKVGNDSFTTVILSSGMYVLPVGLLRVSRNNIGQDIMLNLSTGDSNITIDYVVIKLERKAEAARYGVKGDEEFIWLNVAKASLWRCGGKEPVALVLGFAPLFKLDGYCSKPEFIGNRNLMFGLSITIITILTVIVASYVESLRKPLL